ncbi:MAG: lipase/acyltransferase domain-containing protein [Nostoc sp. DedVER02]|uniref:lipase/acyltransferase domain-containing protein n=1 Tax=unclassified Nostoc TaxID=2593658 RepID=UPI002AD560AB|nr:MULTISPECIES: hypothetical protein [unclassified Nostoc]MDZ7985418.1 hypothetical protein [Nostoc sp. DedVER02]MDZ8116884.1 hypothetical protein [Nostoc sp. DedVER01b]
MVTYPIVLIPGLAGSRLKTLVKGVATPKGVTSGKLWLGLDMAPPADDEEDEVDLEVNEETDVQSLPSNIVGLNVSASDIESDESTEHPRVTNWKRHLKLKDDDGITPEVEENSILNEFNRPLDGLDGISNLFVNRNNVELVAASKPDIKKVNYFLELVNALLDTKEYSAPKNLLAAPYDWRTSPKGLEQRYKYFSNLKSGIETLYTGNGNTRVVIIAQSLGNRVTQYFLEWIKKDNALLGQAWIDKHIERYIAVSAPWLGAPLAIRLVSTDDGFALGGAKLSGIKKALQSFSSIPWLLPITEANYTYFNTQGQFGFIRKEGVNPGQSVDPNNYTSITIEDTLKLGGAVNTTLKYITNHYQNDHNFSKGEFGSKAVKSPPVKNVDVIYSTGFNTPVGAYYYQENGELKVANYLGNETEKLLPVDDGDFIVVNGVRMEKADKTKQLISDDGITNSGDGVVPYGSLAFFKRWEANPAVPNQTITAYPFVKTEPSADPEDKLVKLGIDFSHNSIIRHPDVIKLIFSILELAVLETFPVPVKS